MIIAGPGIPKGKSTDAFAYVWDILPTLLDATGTKYPATQNGKEIEQPRGRSIMPLASGAAEEIYGQNDFVGGEMAGGNGCAGEDTRPCLSPPYGDGNWRLFNLDTDPAESRDLAAEMPGILAELVATWKEYALDVGVISAKL